jgi:hypothetical protein
LKRGAAYCAVKVKFPRTPVVVFQSFPDSERKDIFPAVSMEYVVCLLPFGAPEVLNQSSKIVSVAVFAELPGANLKLMDSVPSGPEGEVVETQA